jgi:hypothetical protein
MTSSLRVIRTTPSGEAAAGPAGPTSAISSNTKRLSAVAAADPAGGAVLPCAADPAGCALADAAALAVTRGGAELRGPGDPGGELLAEELGAVPGAVSFREQPAVRAAKAATSRAGRCTR